MPYRKKPRRATPLSTHIVVGKKPTSLKLTKAEYNKAVKRHVDFADNYNQADVAYFGFSSFSRLDALDILAETIWRKIATRAGAPFTDANSRSRAFPTYWPDKTSTIESKVRSYVRAVRFIWRGETATGMFDPVDGTTDLMSGDTYYTWTLAENSGDQITTARNTDGLAIPTSETAFYNWCNTTAGNQSANTLDELALLLRSKLDAWGQKGRYLSKVEVYTMDQQQELQSSSQPNLYRLIFEMDGFAEAKMKFRVRGEAKIQNVTPATLYKYVPQDAGPPIVPAHTEVVHPENSYAANNIANNSLVGKVFKFAHPTPRFRDQYIQQQRLQGKQGLVNIMVPTQDGRLSTSWLRTNGEFQNSLHPDFRQPVGTTPFRNCVGTTAIKMAPGGVLVLHTDYIYRGTMRSFLLGMSSGTLNPKSETAFTLPTVGDSYLFALENYVRVEDGTSVKLACNREQHFTCDYSLKKSNYIIPTRIMETVVEQA